MPGAALKCLYTNACSMGNQQEELETSVQGYNLVGITETGCDGLQSCNTDTDSLGSTGQEDVEVELQFA